LDSDLIQLTNPMHSNPFSTRFIQPGAIAYHRFDGGSVTQLATRFLELPSKRASIIGPHGSGKSTLVASLVHEFNRMLPDTRIHQLRFSTDQSASTALNTALSGWTQSSIAILDGYEQLNFWSRIKCAWTTRKKSMRILATAHQRIPSFETLWETSVSDSSSEWVINQLLKQSELPDSLSQLLQSSEWQCSRIKHGQNLRESLFDMYDWWHRRH